MQLTSPLIWTGERCMPDAEVLGEFVNEHLHRYAFASEFAHNKRVLDIACGEGYGTAHLAGVAEQITGVDIDAATIEHAKNKYKNTRLTFKEGSCNAIPIDSNSIDLTVSFETIEHINDHHCFLKEIKRVLTSGGILVISTPDKQEYSERPNHVNPFHVKELQLDEFRDLLKCYFRNVTFYQQKSMFASAIVPNDKPSENHFSSYHGDFARIQKVNGLRRPLFHIAICSDESLPLLETSVFEDVTSRVIPLIAQDKGSYKTNIFQRLIKYFRRAKPNTELRQGETNTIPVRAYRLRIERSFGKATPPTQVRARIKNKIVIGTIIENMFRIDVMLKSGMQPVAIDFQDSTGHWAEIERIQIAAPGMQFEYSKM